jgi:hypothetical protein
MSRTRSAVVHEIDLARLTIKNTARDEFRRLLEAVRYRGYEVETLSDGRKIVITKPGRKYQRGPRGSREDFTVWVFDPRTNELWPISHNEILEDLEDKGRVSPKATVAVIRALERVYRGEEPDDFLKRAALSNPSGELPEVLLKAYKWIWGQEDVNYPTGEGRAMSWTAIAELLERLTGGNA